MMSISLAGFFDSKTRSTRRHARAQLRESKKLLGRGKYNIDTGVAGKFGAALEELTMALKGEKNNDKINQLANKLDALTEKHLDAYRKPPWRESLESVTVAIAVALLLRSFVVEAFKIPSGSMIPTLAIGDQIFVNKYIYGMRVPFTSVRMVDFSVPKRGEVIVFICPQPPNDDYIKRVIGVPGDEISVTDGTVFINGEPVPHRATGRMSFNDRDQNGRWNTFDALTFEETLGEHTYTVLQEPRAFGHQESFGPVIVPKGKLFMMGDNRDHSYDSRSWGFVPLSNVLGRSLFVWWSWGRDGLDTGRLSTWIE